MSGVSARAGVTTSPAAPAGASPGHRQASEAPAAPNAAATVAPKNTAVPWAIAVAAISAAVSTRAKPASMASALRWASGIVRMGARTPAANA